MLPAHIEPVYKYYLWLAPKGVLIDRWSLTKVDKIYGSIRTLHEKLFFPPYLAISGSVSNHKYVIKSLTIFLMQIAAWANE